MRYLFSLTVKRVNVVVRFVTFTHSTKQLCKGVNDTTIIVISHELCIFHNRDLLEGKGFQT